MDLNLHLILLSGAPFLLLLGWAWLLVNAFRNHVLWGIGGLIMPLILIVHGLLRLRTNWAALLAFVAGLAFLSIGLSRPIEIQLPAAPYSPSP